MMSDFFLPLQFTGIRKASVETLLARHVDRYSRKKDFFRDNRLDINWPLQISGLSCLDEWTVEPRLRSSGGGFP